MKGTDILERLVSTGWNALFRLIARPEIDRRPGRLILLLRLENMQILTDRLEQAGMSHLLEQEIINLRDALRPQDLVKIVAPGLFEITLHCRSWAAAMVVARRVQQHGQQRLAVMGQMIKPVLTGLLIPYPRLSLISKTRLLRQGQTKMESIGPAELGRIILLKSPRDHLTDELPVTIADAVKAGQMIAYFQPKACCHSGRVTGFEALTRWQHPTQGILPPANFMPGMAEADHNALTATMLQHVLDALAFWDKSGFHVETASLNISNIELGDPGFSDAVLQELEKRQIAPHRLVLELLESMGPINSDPLAHKNLKHLLEAGCRLDLDDFGTGYASLDAIRTFGVHRIKIDRSYVTGCDVDANQQRMLSAILAMAEKLRIETVAEGVETQQEHAYLAQLGCDELQGYAIAKPMPLEQTLEFLARHNEQVDSLSGTASGNLC